MLAILELRIDDLVQLNEGGDELLPDHPLDLPRRVLQPKVVHPILPGHVPGEFVIDGDGGIELLGQDGADLRLIDIYPKGLVVLFLVLLFEQLVEVAVADHLDLGDGGVEEVHEVLAPQDAAVGVAKLVVEDLLQVGRRVQQVEQAQLLELAAELAVGFEQRQHLDVDVVEVRVGGLQADDRLLLGGEVVTALLVEGELHVPHASLGRQQRQLVEALQLQVLQEDQLLAADGEDDVRCYLALAKAEALAVEDYFLLDAHLREPVDHRHEGREPEPFLLRAELVAELGDVLVAVYSLDLVVLHQASEEEA